MYVILRNLLAVVVGVVLGSVVNISIITIGPMLIPPPEGVDMSDMEKFADNLQLLKPINFLAPWLAHALGTLVGAAVAAAIAASHKMKFALGMGVWFLLGGITMVAFYGGPVWFAAADLIGAYIPMAYLGGLLSSGRPNKAVPA